MRTATLQGNLNKACKQVSKALSKRGTLPALTHIKLETHESMFYLTATDLEMAVTVGIGAMNDEDGSICVPGKLFSQLVSKAPKDSRFDLYTDGNTLVVKNGSSEMRLSGIDSEDFPPIPDKFVPYATIEPDTLREAIEQTAYCVAGEDTRPVLTAVCLTPKNGGLEFAAADGFRLGVRMAYAETVGKAQILVRGENLDKLATFLKGVKTPVSILANIITTQPKRYDKVLGEMVDDGKPYTEAVQVAFAWDYTTVTCQCIAGNFPNYQQLIPMNHNTSVTFDREQMASAIASLKPVVKEGSGIVRLELEPQSDILGNINGDGLGKLSLSGRSEQIGDVRHEIDCHYEDTGIDTGARRIAFNARYLDDMLKSLECDAMTMEITTPSSPGLFRPVTMSSLEDNYQHLIMPMFVQWEEKPIIYNAWHDLIDATVGDYTEDEAWSFTELADVEPADDSETTDDTLEDDVGKDAIGEPADMSCDDCGYNPTHGGLCEQVGDTECRAYYDYKIQDERESCPNCDRENLATGYVESWDGKCPNCGRIIPMCATCFYNPEHGGVCAYDHESHNFDCPAWEEYIAPDKQMVESGATILIGGSE